MADNRRIDDFDNWLNGRKKDLEENQITEKIDIISESSNFEYGNSNSFEDDFNKNENNDFIEDDFNDNKNEYREYVDKTYVDDQIRKNKPKQSFLKAVALVLVGAIVGAFAGPLANTQFGNQRTTNNGTQNSNPVNILTKKESNVENAVAKKAIPSVVGIRTKVQRESGFGGTISQGEAIGSGVVVSKDGYILTNAHVVSENTSLISVLFSDNSNAEAKVVWRDTTLDLAILKVNKNNLTPIEFGDSDKIQIGDKAIAIGNPVGLNLQSTLTSGYISGLDILITVQGGNIMNGLIQTDASINSGNSGGALLNSEGKLIGINTAKAGNTDGIGFAIPGNVAKRVMESVINKGEFSQVTLGIRGINVLNYKQYFANYDIKDDKGIFISEVLRGTAAEKAGLKPNDILVGINGEEVISMNKLKQILLKYKTGDTVKLNVHRDGKNVDLNLTFKQGNPDV